MTEAWPLFALLAIFYVTEGFWWVPASCVCFWSGMRRSFLSAEPIWRHARDSRGVLPPRTLLANGCRYLTQAWPLSISPDGITSGGWSAFEALGGGLPGGRSLAFEDVSELSVSGRRLVLRKQTFALLGSSGAAIDMLKLVRSVARTVPEEREAAIRTALEAGFDRVEVRRRIRRLRCLIRGTRMLPLLVLLNLFVLGPLSVVMIGRGVFWAICLAIHVMLAVPVTIAFVRASRRALAPDAVDRVGVSITLLMFAPATARFLEILSCNLLAGMHPLAVASVVLEEEEFARFARGHILAIRQVQPQDRVQRWFRERLLESIDGLLSRTGLSASRILEAPPREPDAVSYCPRCHAQYRDGPERCADCNGVELKSHETP
ncbi:MAG: hypothetical protein GY716_14635 [bacterium]|nr:hypothetical protein [bacterium]